MPASRPICRRAAGAGVPRLFLVLPIAHDRRGQLLGLRLRRDHPGFPAAQLRRAAALAGHLEDLSQHAASSPPSSGRSRCSSASGSPISSPSTSASPTMADGAVPGLHRAVPDLEHHPHDLVDPVPRPQRADQLGAGAARPRSTQPLELLLFSDFAVVLAMVHLYTLFMVTPIFNTLMRIDRSLIEAARDAGASRLADAVERHHPAGQARHRHRLDLRRHAGDGRLLTVR